MTPEEKEKLWERLMGFRDDPEEIENLFEEGSECYQIWEKICACERRIGDEHRRMLGALNQPMNQELEREFEKLFDYYNKSCKFVSMWMFEYGVRYGSGEWAGLY